MDISTALAVTPVNNQSFSNFVMIILLTVSQLCPSVQQNDEFSMNKTEKKANTSAMLPLPTRHFVAVFSLGTTEELACHCDSPEILPMGY